MNKYSRKAWNVGLAFVYPGHTPVIGKPHLRYRDGHWTAFVGFSDIETAGVRYAGAFCASREP